MHPLGNQHTLYLSAGLSALSQPLRDFTVVCMSAKFGHDWWIQCLEVSPAYAREKYLSEAQVGANSDPAFWIRIVDAFWAECFDGRLGPTESAAFMNLRHYRNYVSHDAERLSARDVYQALAAIRLILQKIAPATVVTIDELQLGLRIYHPTCTL